MQAYLLSFIAGYEEIMEILTEEEAFALTKRYTKNPPKVDPSKARIRVPIVRIDTTAVEYPPEKVKAAHTASAAQK